MNEAVRNGQPLFFARILTNVSIKTINNMKSKHLLVEDQLEILEALNILMKHKVEVLFLFMETQYFLQIKDKRKWRVFKPTGTVSKPLLIKTVKEMPYFIRYRCQKIANQN